MARKQQRRTGTLGEISDNAGAVGDLVLLVWQRKAWWLVPLLIALLLLGALLLLEATPVGPLIYPVF
ncbi:MAG TPA: DUF5989 family protein [Chloroflexota bacterium]|jgi:hypothetical protein|nr:DUF5989 family protein [Chloroflexota bacterium]